MIKRYTKGTKIKRKYYVRWENYMKNEYFRRRRNMRRRSKMINRYSNEK